MKIKKQFTRLTIFYTVAIGLIISIIVSIGFFYNAIESVRNSSKSIGHCVADLLDGDKLYNYAMTVTADDEYDATKKKLQQLKSNFSDCKYLYVLVPDGKEYVYVYDIFTEEDYAMGESDDGAFGYRDLFNKENLGSAVDVVSNNAEIGDLDIKLFTNYGALAAYFVPVYGNDGTVKAIIGVDHSIQYIINFVIKMLSLLFVLIIVVVILFAFYQLKTVTKNIVTPIENITKKVSEFANSEHNGNSEAYHFDEKEGSENEIDILSADMNKMVKEIDNYIHNIEAITKERERIGAELDLATRIQASSLPRIFPPFPERPEFNLYATMNPAKEVGGDFYDFFMIDEKHLGLVIADVSGKGVGAALFMMISKTLINNQASFTASPAAVLEAVNNKLCADNEAEMFVTVWFGILDVETGLITAANAGHEFPAIKKANGEFELFQDRHGFVLGGMPNMKYKEYEIQLNKGDMIYVYTDGVAEATNAENELYGTSRMIAALNKSKNLPVDEILKSVRVDIDEFVKEAPQFDDITMLALKYIGNNT